MRDLAAARPLVQRAIRLSETRETWGAMKRKTFSVLVAFFSVIMLATGVLMPGGSAAATKAAPAGNAAERAKSFQTVSAPALHVGKGATKSRKGRLREWKPPANYYRPGGDRPGPRGKPGSTPPAPPRAAMAKAARILTGGDKRAAAQALESAVVGKIRYEFGDGSADRGECSGAALDSGSKQLVVTAAHCVNVNGHYHTNWWFYPGYKNGPGQFGGFQAMWYRVFDGWLDYGTRQWDVAMVTTWPQPVYGKLVNAVGGYGLQWNQPLMADTLAYGYPAAKSDGKVQYTCQRTSGYNVATQMITMPDCDLTSGASGGPWLRDYAPTGWSGWVDGVTSTYNPLFNFVESPIFDEYVKGMYDAQGDVTDPPPGQRHPIGHRR